MPTGALLREAEQCALILVADGFVLSAVYSFGRRCYSAELGYAV
jgi:hypothetical protein